MSNKTKVALLGDSIRLIGYGRLLPQLLGDDFEVWQPEDNCRFAQYCMRLIFDYSADIEGSRIIHFNSGLWDENDLFGEGSFTPISQYVQTVRRMAAILQSKCDALIFATTTPVRNTAEHNNNARIKEYNSAVVPELKKMGVVINDLHYLVYEDIDRYIRQDDKIHLTEDGMRVCAEQCAKVIKAEAEKLQNRN